MGYGATLTVAQPSTRGAPITTTAGRDEQIAALFDEHAPRLVRLAAFLLDDPAAAEEVVQDAFLRTYTGWWRLRHPERAQWYLRTAVVNLCRSRGRRRASEQRGNRTTWATEGGDQPWEREDPDDAMAVVEAVRALPPRQREAVVLRYYQDLSEADIARTLRCAPGTVKSQLAKARATLARTLAEPAEDGADQ
ncbi:MAG TPA: SigE family RNA polymerase sigma factor [Acidimicrobiales bacterium]|nr:SigE family RNA polymerase sigma factor [Acidimicrobiales bacterium]